MTDKYSKIREIDREIKELYERRLAAAKEAFKPLDIITFNKWGGDIRAQVLDVFAPAWGHSIYLQVRNIRSRKVLRISLYDALK